MATQPLGEANEQLWDETLSRLLSTTCFDSLLNHSSSAPLDLSSATVRRNTDLENRVAELEVELLVWKQAHSVALEASEREVKAHNVQIAALNRQISNLDCFKTNQNPLILCIINGDELVFNRELLNQGYQGGRAAAQQLTQAIAEHLSKEETQVYGRLSFWITIYLTKSELAEDLSTNSICSQEQFRAFLAGFSEASPRFSTVDVGYSRDAVEAKIKGKHPLEFQEERNEYQFRNKEYLQTFTRFPQTLRVFFGGYDVMAYTSTFSALEKDQILGKLVLLYSTHDNIADDNPGTYSLPRLVLNRLFLSEKVPSVAKKLAPLATGPFSSVTSNGGLISPQSPARSVGRPIDPSLPLHKQNPPPCNEHYLMVCSKGAGICKYSHEYVLTPEQLVSLANNAKKAPCNWLKNGVQCPYGDQCCWGHICPNGPKCFHLSKGKCWFKGEAMHPELSP